jgi:hypothetical protein
MRVGYSALLLSSNPSLCACQSGERSVAKGFDEPRILATAAPSAAPAPLPKVVPASDRLGRYCYEHLVPGDTVHQDVHRLGVLCGPSTGLKPLAGESVATGTGVGFRKRLDDRECVRAAIATSAAEPLEVEWRARDRVLASCTIDRLGWCPLEFPLCLASRDLGSGKFDVELVFPEASEVPVALRVWHRRE